MSGLRESCVAARRIVYRLPVALLLIVAALLFAISSLLQWNASMQRWVTFGNSRGPHDLSVDAVEPISLTFHCVSFPSSGDVGI